MGKRGPRIPRHWDPYTRLACATVTKAFKDYHYLTVALVLAPEGVYRTHLEEKLSDIEHFFQSNHPALGLTATDWERAEPVLARIREGKTPAALMSYVPGTDDNLEED